MTLSILTAARAVIVTRLDTWPPSQIHRTPESKLVKWDSSGGRHSATERPAVPVRQFFEGVTAYGLSWGPLPNNMKISRSHAFEMATSDSRLTKKGDARP
ncbi:unnamed protein product [Clonostachys chloroleuca]|uniref:Uncharacterized protein n=1 Tax=Clonostachys chloroleuca TaxID=1926264 RepID=A0AA35LX90_9HYPO|nr:unnamed protein product [Clonostachys chloroleuca]